MKNAALITLLLIVCIGFSSGQDTLLLFHPTTNNIAVIKNLTDEKILNLDGYHVLGVYHCREAYDYEKTRISLQEKPDLRFSLFAVSGELDQETLFGSNPCSEAFSALFKSSRGALFMGGPDIPPGIYKEPVHLLTDVTDPFRHLMEISFLFHLLGGNQDSLWVPFLEGDVRYLISGICLGMQSMNVATGGTLIQDIPTEVYGIWNAEEILALPPDQMHRNYADMVQTTYEKPSSYHFHRIRCAKGSFFIEEIGYREETGPLVMSSHHQSAEIPGQGWVVSATSMDGKIIEAIEHNTYPNVTGVQFHPELKGLYDSTLLHPQSCDGAKDFDFHKSYWKYLGDILQENRRKTTF
ncbi:MAG: gamma-glutamyl-gamma-aminobutyrate hydrolase family protein [Bacteroidota bacterium]